MNKPKINTNNIKIRVLMVLPSLRAGGAERVISFISQNLSRERFEVLLVIAAPETENSYNVNNVNTVYLNKGRVLTAVPGIIRQIRIFRPNVVLGAIEHLNAVLGVVSVLFPKVKFIGREVNVMSVLKNVSTSPRKSIIAPYVYKFGYKKLDRIICQSKDMEFDFAQRFPFAKNKINTINNPITIENISKGVELGSSNLFRFITVGRLAKQKGHLRILEVLSALQFPFIYTIVGDGPEKDTLFDSIRELGLTDRIHYIPFSSEVPKLLAENDIFLQGSYVEGFPNALLESCAVGTPVIAYRAPGGIDEIIEPGINGYIANDDLDFRLKIEKLTQEIQHWHRRDVSNSVYRRYGRDKILEQYENLFKSVGKSK
jgi:glycosyltransferase involved in cell wall biosynthesis